MSSPYDVSPKSARAVLGNGLPRVAQLNYPQQTAAQEEIKALARELFLDAMKDESWSEEPDVAEIRVIARWAHDAAIIFLDELSQ
jgi:hypothetical protein